MIRLSLLVFFIVVASSPAIAEDLCNQRLSEDARIARNASMKKAARIGAGAAIGGRVGSIVSGSAKGTAAGIFLSPSQIACGPNETCAKGYKRVSNCRLPPPKKTKAKYS